MEQVPGPGSRSEESLSSTKPTVAQPPLPPAAAPSSQPVPATSQSSLTQSQLLAKQKQLELKMGKIKGEELKEKKTCNEKKATEKAEFKANRNMQPHAGKRARSHSRSRSPISSPKRMDRRSPERRAHSSSSSLSPLDKAGKPWSLEPPHGKPSQENRLSPIPHFKSLSDKHPGHRAPHNQQHPPSQYNGPGHLSSPRPHPPAWYQGSGPGRFNYPQFKGSHHPWPGRFEGSGPLHHNMMEWVDRPRHMAHGPLRGMHPMGRVDGPPQGPGRFRGPIGQQLPVRYEGQGPGPRPGQGHSQGPMQHFQAPHHFNSMGPGPGLASAPMGFQQWPSCFNGPLRFDGPGHFQGPCQPGPQYDVLRQGGPQHFQNFPGHLGFNPQHNLEPSMRPVGPPIYENPLASQQIFPMAPQGFPKPMNPQFPTPSVAFPGQQNIQPVGNFNVQPQISLPAVGLQQPVMGNMNQPFLPQNPVPFPQQNLKVNPPENCLSQTDVNNLLSKLISAGIIKASQPEAAPASSSKSSSAPPAAPPVEEKPEMKEDDVPDLTSFDIDKLKQRYESVVTELYSGRQCSLCGMRFPDSETDKYTKHLDWHFRQNRANKKGSYRGWYLSVNDWIHYDESDNPENHSKSQVFEKEKKKVQKNQAKEEFQSVSATKGQVDECCENCQEPFETYWVEKEEDWFLKNAIKVDDKNFHPACFEDYKKNMLSNLDVTPSPASS